MSIVYLGTSSDLKANALRAFFADDVVIRPTQTKTALVQPLGGEQARACLRERLAQALAVATAAEPKRADALAVACENFIFPLEDVETGAFMGYYDTCLVAMQRGAETEPRFSAVVRDACVAVPAAMTALLDANSPPHKNTLTRTIGQLLYPHLGHDAAYNHQDWFAAAGAKFGRKKQIAIVLDTYREMFPASLLRTKD